MFKVLSQSHDQDISRAKAALLRGDVIGLPTETVYGLAGDASNPQAVARIFSLKGRPADHPVIVHLARTEHIRDWAIDIPAAAWPLAEKFWPGPMTVILKRGAHVSDLITGGQDTVGLRVPSHPLALELLESFARGIAAPSANRFGRISPTTAQHVRDEFGDAVPIVLDGGACSIGIESTIIDLSSGRARLLRPGMITHAQIRAVIGDLDTLPKQNSPRVSGALKAHYAPRTSMISLTREALVAAINKIDARSRTRIGLLTCTAQNEMPHNICLGQDPHQYARDLYAAMHTLDAAQLAEIWVEQPPLELAWAAIHDRLMRAVAGAGIEDEAS